MYREHAVEYGPKLDLRVAAKGKDGTPMAGFQLPQLDKYLKILVQDLDKHVAICAEFPEYIDGERQFPIPRRVTRIVTPGTLIDEEFVEQDRNNFLLSVHCMRHVKNTENANASDQPESIGLAWIDVSTGQFFLQTVDRADLLSSLLCIGATEVVLSDSIPPEMKDQVASALDLSPQRMTSLTSDAVSPLQVDGISWTQRLDQPLGPKESAQISTLEDYTCRQLFGYIDIHLLELELKPKKPQRIEQSGIMLIDRSSIRGLELLKTTRDGLGKGSLINSIQRTKTKGGARLLRQRLIYPSIIPEIIEHRLDLVSAFLSRSALHQTILVLLEDLFDVRRIAQKIALNKGYAEDFLCLSNSISDIEKIVRLLESAAEDPDSQGKPFLKLISQIDMHSTRYLSEQIKFSIDEQELSRFRKQTGEVPPEEPGMDAATNATDLKGSDAININPASIVTARSVVDKAGKEDPWIIQRNASNNLQSLHVELDNLCQQRDALQDSLRGQLSSPKLILKYDTRFGHICQAPKSKNFDEDAFERLGSTLVGNMRTTRSFYISKWTKLGRGMDNLIFEIRKEEQKVFQRLRDLVADNLVALRQNASAMDELDVAASFATLAFEEDWTRPQITTRPMHTIVGGRHPTVKRGLQEKGQSFVSNDLSLDRKTRAWLITGPNMAGKSTFLRQNALITILAQVGSYVPAEYAEVGIVDRIFSRIGAADDLFRNESTFMVEMLETASILRDATERSFVIMDEVGRGTAPEDGTAVAYASLHHLYHVNKCRTLFATHFHDLADRTAEWPQLLQYCTDLYEDENGAFTFIHKLRPGVNRQSHALRVAKMAGLPSAALEVAQQMLDASKESADTAE